MSAKQNNPQDHEHSQYAWGLILVLAAACGLMMFATHARVAPLDREISALETRVAELEQAR